VEEEEEGAINLLMSSTLCNFIFFSKLFQLESSHVELFPLLFDDSLLCDLDSLAQLQLLCSLTGLCLELIWFISPLLSWTLPLPPHAIIGV
jgi:hypothetical protein